MLLDRFTRGLPLPSASGYGDAQYYGEDAEDMMIDPRTLDLAEKEDLIRQQKTTVYAIKKRLEAEQKQAAGDAAAAAAAKAAAEKILSEKAA